MNFLKNLRTFKSPFNNIIINSTLRGAKRKGDKKADGILSEHILNIYKINPDDTPILPDEYYPPWVLDLAREPMNMEDMFCAMIVGQEFPPNQDMFAITKKISRHLKKNNNRVKTAYRNSPQKWEKGISGDEQMLDHDFGDLPDKLSDWIRELDTAQGMEVEPAKPAAAEKVEKKA